MIWHGALVRGANNVLLNPAGNRLMKSLQTHPTGLHVFLKQKAVKGIVALDRSLCRCVHTQRVCRTPLPCSGYGRGESGKALVALGTVGMSREMSGR